jgi:hypothetical protein
MQERRVARSAADGRSLIVHFGRLVDVRPDAYVRSVGSSAFVVCALRAAA